MMILKAKYELNGETHEKEFFQEFRDEQRQQFARWMQGLAKSEESFRYLGSETISLLEVDQQQEQETAKQEIAVAVAEPPKVDSELSLFYEEEIIVVKPTMSKFEEWFRTFIDEKDLPVVEWKFDNARYIDIHLDNYDAVEVICEKFSAEDQAKVKDTMVRLDIMNGDINHFLYYILEAYVETL